MIIIYSDLTDIIDCIQSLGVNVMRPVLTKHFYYSDIVCDLAASLSS